MSQCTLNGIGIFEGRITFPRIGVWHADLSISSSVNPSGSAQLVIGSQTWSGFFSLQSGLDLNGRQRVRVVGGKGSIGNTVQAKGYNGILALIPLQDTMNDAGEALSPTSDTGVTNQPLSSWIRFQSPGSAALQSLLQAIPNNPSWRVIPDGTIWVGFETWPVVTLVNTGYRHSDPSNTSLVIGSFDPDIRPGQILQINTPLAGQQLLRISTVTHLVSGSEIQTLLRYENSDTTSETDRSKSSLTKFIRKVMGSFLVTKIDYLASYTCKVVSQNSDGTLELIPDDVRLSPMSNVPIYYGIPGVVSKVNPGSRCLVAFAGGDPRGKMVTGWPASSVSEMTLQATETNLSTGIGSTINIGSIDPSSAINIGGATALVARMGDQVIGTAGPFPLAAMIGPPITNTNTKA